MMGLDEVRGWAMGGGRERGWGMHTAPAVYPHPPSRFALPPLTLPPLSFPPFFFLFFWGLTIIEISWYCLLSIGVGVGKVG